MVQRRRDNEAALKLLTRLPHNQSQWTQKVIVTDGPASYGSALWEIGLERIHQPAQLKENHRVENSHPPIRRRERRQ